MPRAYLITILRRSVAFWLIVRLWLAVSIALFAPGQPVWPMTPGNGLAFIGIIAVLVNLDLRSVREHILLGNFGMPAWAPALTAGLLVAGLELLLYVVHLQLLPSA